MAFTQNLADKALYMTQIILAVVLLSAVLLRWRFIGSSKVAPEPKPVINTEPKGIEAEPDGTLSKLTFKIAESVTIPTVIFKLPNDKLIYLGATLNVPHPTYSKLLKSIGTHQIHNILIDEIKKMPTIDPNKLTEQIKNSINAFLLNNFQTDITSQDPITSITLQEFRIE